MVTTTINFEFRNQILATHNGTTLSYCYQCGTCSGGCPSAQVTDGVYNPRKIIIESLLGLQEKLIEKKIPNVWLCATCQKCVEQCPQDVELTEIFTLLKNLSTAKGLAPKAFYAQGKTIQAEGKAIPLQAAIARRRTQLGIPDAVKPALAEVQAIMKHTGFEQKLAAAPKEELTPKEKSSPKEEGA